MSVADLEKRIQAIEDIEEIKRLHQNYINAMDNLDYEKVPDYFTDNATVEVRQSGLKNGRREIEDFYINVLAKSRGGARYDGHMAVEPDIRVDGDTAHGTWLIYMLFSKPSIQWVQGRNECEYRREDGKWKISRLKFTRTLASDPKLYP
jgi:ketosteroid isomerase-like protein